MNQEEYQQSIDEMKQTVTTSQWFSIEGELQVCWRCPLCDMLAGWFRKSKI